MQRTSLMMQQIGKHFNKNKNMKTIILLIGLFLSVNTFASMQLKSGQTYEDEYGNVHSQIWGKVTYEISTNHEVPTLVLHLNFYISEQAKNEDKKPLKSFRYVLQNANWDVFWNANPRIQDIESLAETWILNNDAGLNSIVEVAP